MVLVVECLPTRAFLGSSPHTIKIRVRHQGSCSSFVDPALGGEDDLPHASRAERSCHCPPVSPHCLRLPSLMVCPRCRQCGTQEGTCAEVWELGWQSGGTPKPPLSQAIHWPVLPPPCTPRLVSRDTIACSFITAQEVALYWVSQSFWGQQEGEGLVMQGRAAQSRNFH